MNPTKWTNATKGQVSIVINAWLALAVLAGVDATFAAALGFALNVTFGAFLGITYKQSPKRRPDIKIKTTGHL